MGKKADKDIQEIMLMLHLDEGSILENYNFTLEGKLLTQDEAVGFIRFIRNQLADSTK